MQRAVCLDNLYIFKNDKTVYDIFTQYDYLKCVELCGDKPLSANRTRNRSQHNTKHDNV